ncbi:MAG TPA: hypothetical protein VK277_01470 [Acidimicrobiales bacterium]|nr:hypothetical protein [Acidimicrobiales bacterium]
MLFVHEVHRVVGEQEDEFDEAYREGWMPTLAETDDARLLWYLRLAHGSGAAYVVVTITAVRDGAAWHGLSRRLLDGDLRSWAAQVDAMRHGSTAKILAPVPWSPIQEVDLATVPTSGERQLTVYMEDTVWPFRGGLPAYLEAAGTLYHQATLGRSKEQGNALIEIEAAFQPVFGAGHPTEVVLMQRVVDQRALLGLLTHETPPAMKQPGNWMIDALAYRDQWESRLLRTASWSPRN